MLFSYIAPNHNNNCFQVTLIWKPINYCADLACNSQYFGALVYPLFTNANTSLKILAVASGTSQPPSRYTNGIQNETPTSLRSRVIAFANLDIQIAYPPARVTTVLHQSFNANKKLILVRHSDCLCRHM